VADPGGDVLPYGVPDEPARDGAPRGPLLPAGVRGLVEPDLAVGVPDEDDGVDELD